MNKTPDAERTAAFAVGLITGAIVAVICVLGSLLLVFGLWSILQ